MKFYSLVALTASVAVAKKSEEKEKLDLFKGFEKDDTEAVERTFEDKLEGFKSFYDGAYKAFYHASSKDPVLNDCMNAETVENIAQLAGIIQDPLSMFELKNLKSDLNLFGAAAEVTSDLAQCHFEQPFFDIWGMCTGSDDEVSEDADDLDAEAAGPCAIPTLTQNLTKNMFVLVGKLTQMGESFTEMKGAEQKEFEEICKEVGDGMGTIVRDVFAFTGKPPGSK